MNFASNLDSVFTLAHELGHSMHSYFSRASQPYHLSRYSIFVAEVASTVNECLLMHYLQEKARAEGDRDLLTYLVNSSLDDFKGTVFRQVQFAEFDLAIHSLFESGGSLTLESLSGIYLRLNSLYYGEPLTPEEHALPNAPSPIPMVDPQGPHTSVRANRLIRLEYTRIPHFFYNFYVWKYATSFCAAQTFVGQILLEHTRGACPDRYLSFLRAGCTKDPADILADAGVDLRQPTVILGSLQKFGNLVDELSSLLPE